MATNWNYDKTVSPAKTIVIKYVKEVNGTFVQQTARLKSTAWSETINVYNTVSYKTREYYEKNDKGVFEKKTEWSNEEVLSSKVTTTRDTVASVNGALVKWCLEKGEGLPQGDMIKQSRTEYKYTVRDFQGVKPYSERTEEWIDEIELIGSLNINDYEAIGGGSLSAGTSILSQITEVEYEEFNGDITVYNEGTKDEYSSYRQYNKVKTKRWLSAGLTQEGQQAAAEMLKLEDGTGTVSWSVIKDFAPELTFEGTEIRSSIGKLQYTAKPSEQQEAADEIKDPTDPELDPDQLGAGSVALSGNDAAAAGASSIFDLDSQGTDWNDYAGDSNGDGVPDWADWLPDGEDWTDYDQDSNGDGVPDWGDYVPGGGGGGDDKPTTVTYDMPFPPDDYYDNNGNLVRGNAAQAAAKYGQTLNSLTAATAYGFNITTAADRVASQPLSSIYVEAGGVRVQGQMNGTSWAMGNMGLVVSADVMLSGAVSRSQS